MSVYPRKDGVYVYDFQVQRVRFSGATGVKSRRAAEEIERTRWQEARQHLAAIRAQRSGPMTVNIAFDRFWQEVADQYDGNYRATVWKALGWLSEALGPTTLIRDIGPNRITEAIAKRRGEGVKNATVNRTATELLRRVMIRAQRKWEQQVQAIDWKDFLLPEPQERVRELRDHEETALFDAMRDDYRPALRFALLSGFRLKEVVGLKWADIDWSARTIAVTGKGNRPATIPLTDAMRAILGPLRGQHADMVFTFLCRRTMSNPKTRRPYIKGLRYPTTYAGLKTAWRRYGATAIDDFRFHDVRHTSATRLLRESGNLKLVQRLLRHQEIATTVKYAHADDADLRRAMEAVEKSQKISHTKRGAGAKRKAE
jgi:integrase